jgi:hypothetical protein
MSYVDDLKASACDGKKRFLSRKQAKTFYKKLNVKNKESLNAYRCDFCGLYHLGHLQPGNLLRTASYNAYYSPDS